MPVPTLRTVQTGRPSTTVLPLPRVVIAADLTALKIWSPVPSLSEISPSTASLPASTTPEPDSVICACFALPGFCFSASGAVVASAALPPHAAAIPTPSVLARFLSDSANAAARALYERRGFEAIEEDSLTSACAAAVAREIEGSDEAQILMRLPGTGKKPKPAKKRKRSKGFSRKR